MCIRGGFWDSPQDFNGRAFQWTGGSAPAPFHFFPSWVFFIFAPMIRAEHLIVREMKTWRSYGILGKGPIEDTLIKDLKDDHLINIIRHLE